MEAEPTVSFEVVLQKAKTYITKPDYLHIIEEAYSYAEKMHRGIKRKSGSPYIIHPLWTAYYLCEWNLSHIVIAAGLLHDVLEDTPVTYEELQEKFGLEISNIVESITKVTFFAKKNRAQIKSQYLRKLYLAMAHDVRVIIVKLADRLHNLTTLRYLNHSKQKIVAQESLDIYASIAHRLGMTKVQEKIEDLCFAVLKPKSFREIQAKIELSNKAQEQVIQAKITQLTTMLSAKKISFIKICGRYKSSYSIFRKIEESGKTFDDIYDLIALRIILNSVDDCYRVLGYIHQNYTPLAKRFKDYIAAPKNNLYQSLHTTVVSDDAFIIEIQIRTQLMDEVAEQGIAAHWRYKEGEKINSLQKQQDIDEMLGVFKRILDLEKITSEEIKEIDAVPVVHANTPRSLENLVQKDIFATLIYALTPNKKIITLPFGSTVIDFAYQIHTEIGDTATGAKINGVFAPISTILNSGDVVEVKTASQQKPNHSWLLIAKTSHARNKIKKYLRSQMAEQDSQNNTKIAKIKKDIQKYIDRNNLQHQVANYEEKAVKLRQLGFTNLESFLYEVMKKKYSIKEAVLSVYLKTKQKVASKLEPTIKFKTAKKTNNKNDIIIEGVSGVVTKISKCCLPLPNEEIVGYITKTEGIKIHLLNCENMLRKNLHKIIKAYWNEEISKSHYYFSSIKIKALNRVNLLSDIARVLARNDIPVEKIQTNKMSNLIRNSLKLLIKVKDKQQLQKIIQEISNISNIEQVTRTSFA